MGYLPEVFEKKMSLLLNKIYGYRKPDDLRVFLSELLTKRELGMLMKRIDVMEMLSHGFTQRTVAKVCHVSISKVVRLANILKESRHKKFWA